MRAGNPSVVTREQLVANPDYSVLPAFDAVICNRLKSLGQYPCIVNRANITGLETAMAQIQPQGRVGKEWLYAESVWFARGLISAGVALVFISGESLSLPYLNTLYALNGLSLLVNSIGFGLGVRRHASNVAIAKLIRASQEDIPANVYLSARENGLKARYLTAERGWRGGFDSRLEQCIFIAPGQGKIQHEAILGCVIVPAVAMIRGSWLTALSLASFCIWILDFFFELSFDSKECTEEERKKLIDGLYNARVDKQRDDWMASRGEGPEGVREAAGQALQRIGPRIANDQQALAAVQAVAAVDMVPGVFVDAAVQQAREGEADQVGVAIPGHHPIPAVQPGAGPAEAAG